MGQRTRIAAIANEKGGVGKTATVALEDLFDTIENIKEEIHPDITISGIIPTTFFDQRTRISRNILERLQSDERYKDLLFATSIRANTIITASTDTMPFTEDVSM